jgi:methylenetetrahydrofolate--tRNA-(uracil-5-)-methyltransferase
MKKTISIIGAGLAGSECALQLAKMGFQVDLFEMRDLITSPAHKTPHFAELVCSNSFGSFNETSAAGQLKWEAQKSESFILKAAHLTQVPAGQALGVDREKFSKMITDWISEHPLIKVHRKLITDINELPRPLVVATGPLTHESLAASIQKHFGGDFLYFFDAIAPIVDADTINTEIAWKADRYDKGTPDYYNCPLNKEEYFRFIDAIKNAKKIEPKHFETTPFFEGCMPIETMVERGVQTLRFGPMKPVGLTDPRTGRYPFAAVQLRQENKEATSYNIVGFQTRMAYGDQKEVFRLIPGLENAEFLKLGSMHRNLFINSPKLLNPDFSSKNDPLLFFAGQITGVEGYFESTSTGLLVAKFIEDKCSGLYTSADFNNSLEFNTKDYRILPPRHSAMGSLINAINDPMKIKHFQPTNINMGLFPPLEAPPKDKSEKKSIQIQLAQKSFEYWISSKLLLTKL